MASATVIIVVFLGVIIPIGVASYLLMRMIRPFIGWFDTEEGSDWIPVFTALIGTALGAIPGLVQVSLDIALGIANPSTPHPHISWGAGVFFGLFGGLFAPSIYALVHKVMKRMTRLLKDENS